MTRRRMALTIYSHRGNVTGPGSVVENSVEALAACIARGWGVETDLRRDTRGRLYVSHDEVPSPAASLLFSAFDAVWSAPRGRFAMNVKETGYEAQLLDAARAVEGEHFFFDMELVEPPAHRGQSARRFRAASPSVQLAARVSDRGESIDTACAAAHAQLVWLDEFDGPWCTREQLERLKRTGKQIIAVSPELHGRGDVERRERWAFLLSAGVDGICTDFPAELESFARKVAA